MRTLVPEEAERPSAVFGRRDNTRCDSCHAERTCWEITLGDSPGIFLCADCLVDAAQLLRGTS
jgi:hypothetical protein